MDPVAPRRNANHLQSQYLTAYNGVSTLLWLTLLGRVLLLVPLAGFDNVYPAVGQFTKWTQTLALLEVAHSALGIVRSPILTTVLQVASRIMLVWGVVNSYPEATTSSPFYSSMLVAWSVTEVIRYSFFVFNLQGGVPKALSWLRYNTFFVLYPLGITSEVVLTFKATLAAEAPVSWALWVVLAIYVPGAYVLYTHMMTQRRKVMRGKAPEKRRR